MIRFLFLLGGLGTGETLHTSQQEKSPLWIQSPEETSRVWIHGSRFSVPVPYYTQLKHTHKHARAHTHTYIYIYTHTHTHTHTGTIYKHHVFDSNQALCLYLCVRACVLCCYIVSLTCNIFFTFSLIYSFRRSYRTYGHVCFPYWGRYSRIGASAS